MHNRENRKGHLTVCPSEYRINCILRIRTVRHFAGQLWPSGCMSVSAAPEQMCLPKSMGNYTMYAGTRIPPAEPHRLACGVSQWHAGSFASLSKSIISSLQFFQNFFWKRIFQCTASIEVHILSIEKQIVNIPFVWIFIEAFE